MPPSQKRFMKLEKPGDFWGLKNALENCRAESKSTGSTNPGFSLKGLSYTTIEIGRAHV